MQSKLLFLFLVLATSLQAQQNYRYNVAKKVLQKLTAAKGNAQMKVPSFALSDKREMVAWMDGEIPEIGLEIAAYDICKTFGADSLNALAALLSHEVTHYYEKHDWGNHFATAYGASDMGKQVKKAIGNVNSHASDETQADHLGGFLAYAAGYKTFGIVPDLLDKVYKEYDLPNELQGYPSKEDRKSLAKKSADDALKLARLFDAANYLSMMGSFQSADECYSELLKTFQSREIYNNAGVNICLMLLKCFDTQDVAKYAYPLEFDVQSRLETGSLGVSYDDEQKAELYAKADVYFKSAESLDPNYISIKINRACLAILQKSYTDADYLTLKAEEMAAGDTFFATDALILKGIAAAKRNKKEDANNYFKEAFEKSGKTSRLALVNLQILNGKKLKDLQKYYRLIPGVTEDMVASEGDFKKGVEKINGNTLEKTAFENESKKTDYALTTKYLDFKIKNLDNQSFLITSQNLETHKTDYIQLLNDQLKSTTTRAISKGDSAAKVYQLYGNPAQIHNTPTGDFFFYTSAGIILKVVDGVVCDWVLVLKG